MGLTSLLVANRAEIAIRIVRAAREAGLRTVTVYPEDDAASLHTRVADESRLLTGSGARAYLDAEQMVQVALDSGSDAVHPGYGFLSENPHFAGLCAEAGLVFIGPRPDVLELFGDKTRGRQLAGRCDVPVLAGTTGPTTLEEAREFFAGLPAGASAMVKAVAGGGGRGIQVVDEAAGLPDAHERCSSIAQAAFGNGDVYLERYVPRARHIEVQVAGDGTGAVSHLWERDCSIQRQHQKIIEVAPSPGIPGALRERLVAAAVRMASEVRYSGLGTFEFLVDAAGPAGPGAGFAFIEANPRLQVEHTVTEELLGVDLVRAQLRLAAGETLAEAGLDQDSIPAPRGYALQARVNLETMAADGTARPASGVVSVFEPPSGPGVRVDTFGYSGYRTSASYDSLLAKVIASTSGPRFEEVAARAGRALAEFRLEGVESNMRFLQAIVTDPGFVAGDLHTGFLADRIRELTARLGEQRRLQFPAAPAASPSAAVARPSTGAAVDSGDPLAVLDHGKTGAFEAPPLAAEEPGGAVAAPIQGTVVSVHVAEGEQIRAGQQLLVIEAMKMEHVVTADVAGVVRRLGVGAGQTVTQGHPLAVIDSAGDDAAAATAAEEWDPGQIRADLAEAMARHELGYDAARPDAVARRRGTGQRTARENIDDLCDDGTFVEYGPLVIAAQRQRRPVQELISKTPADGLISGVGKVNSAVFGPEKSQCLVMSYDYTVFAGTQGHQNHKKKDRMFELAETRRLPVVFFTEGGGGRPGDTDGHGVAALDVLAFNYFARLSGLVPLVGINSGRCFAGNAALLGCCDVVIATANSTIGMGGPAMIEGGGLGVFRPEEVGPISVQARNGVVDIPVADEAEAVQAAKKYLSYFQGRIGDWECADQRRLRSIVPENRLRIYDVRQVIEVLADTGSVLEIRRHFGPGMVTALARVEGRPVGVIANNPAHLAGAVDSDGADKASRFMQLCDAFGLPILFLCDTPGIMVGPDAEKTGTVRHASRMFVTGASLAVPFFTIVLRKAYGLGAQAMAGGSFRAPRFTVAWPTGEFGGMGIEGAVKLGYRNELAAIQDPAERKAVFDQMVAERYEEGKALNTASHFELDDVIDPMDSRRWIMSAIESPAPATPRSPKKRPCIDTW
jgi:acetyl/propionyl-CoA carboxylase alpha subunit/acetyl-CoA carboxylase carboxyltransferase component